MAEEYYKDNLDGMDWMGEVVDVNDPDHDGKIRVKVFGKFDDLKDDEIPWATPCNINMGGSKTGGSQFSVPKKGSLVYVSFENGDLYHPKWKHQYKISDELLSEIEGDYENAHSLLYDTEIEGELKMYFVSKKGLMIEYNGSLINLKPDKTIILRSGKDGKIIHLQDNKISLGKEKESKEPVVMGDTAVLLLNEFITDLGLIGAILTNTGITAPISSSPNWAALVSKWTNKWKQFNSKVTTTD